MIGTLSLCACLIAGLIAAAPASAAPTLIGPTPYAGFPDSPFKGVSFSQFYLEDFESGQLGSPGVSASNNTPGQSLGMVSSGGTTDSVDAEDGAIDGLGRNGYSFGEPNNASSGELGYTFEYGIQLRPFSNDHQFNQFHSSDYMQRPDLRPKLVIKPQ
jgi:hypothetical protein